MPVPAPAGGDQLLRRRVPAGIGGVQAAGNGAVPVVGGAAAGVRVAPVEAVLPLRQRAGIADGGVARAVGQIGGIQRSGYLVRDDGHRGVLVARNDRFDAKEQRQVLVGVQVLDERVLELLQRLPAPHVAGCAGPGHITLGRDAGVHPRRAGAHARDERISGRGQRRVFNQRAVAVAVSAVAGLHEPVEAPGRVQLVGRLLDQLLHRGRTVRTGGVIVKVTGHVLAGRLVLGNRGRRRQRAGNESGDECNLAESETQLHRVAPRLIGNSVRPTAGGRGP